MVDPKVHCKSTTANKNKSNRAASSSKAKKGSNSGSVRTVAVPVRNYTIMTSKVNSFSLGMEKYAGRNSTIIKGSCLLQSLYAPRLPPNMFTVNSIVTVPINNIPMHPVHWGCNRVMNQFTSFVRWKAKSLRVKFVPYVGAYQPGQILMAFTSCIQDGGPDGSGELFQSAMMDIPGSISCSLGYQSNGALCKMPFIDAFDWGFCCRAGNDINEIYQGAFIVGLTGGVDLFGAPSSVYLGQLILEYEIALSEPASILNLVRPAVKGVFYDSALANKSALQARVPTSVVKPGDILALPWYPPADGVNPTTWTYYDRPVNGTRIKQGPGIGDTVYARAGYSDGDYTQLTFHPSLAAATRNQTLGAPADVLVNETGSTINTSTWLTTSLDLAKVILPTLVDVAATVLL